MPDLTWLMQALGLGARIWFGLTLACAILLFGPQFGLTFLNGVSDTWLGLARVGLVLFGSLSIVSVLAALWSGVQWGGTKVGGWWAERARQAAAEATVKARKLEAAKLLNDLTKEEKEILSYLVTKNERHFKTASDGGRASGLLGRGIIHIAAYRGQSIDMLSTPFSVHEDVWEALLARKDEFVHPNLDGRPPYSNSPFA